MEEILLAVAAAGAAGTAGYWFRPTKMRLPKCLVCSARLNTATKQKLVQCGRCQILYNRTTILEADPLTWEQIRQERLFSLSFRRDIRRQHLILEMPLSELKGPRREAAT
jgi:hypothetical protein